MNASTIRFDSIRSRKRNRHRPRAASLPRPRSIDVLAPSRVSVSRVVVASSRRRIHPARPAADTVTEHTNTHTHTGLNAPRLRKTTRCLPREIKNKNTYPSHLSSVYDPSVPPSYTHTCSDIRKPTVGPDATETEDDAVVVRLRRRRAFVRASVRSIDRARRSRSRRALCAALARACAVEEEARGVVVVAVVPIERTRDGRTDRTRA